MDTGTIELADALLENCWQPAPYDMVCFDGLPTWTEDPVGEKYWRFVVYALRPLRHLVFARLTTGDPVYSDKIVDILETFVASGAEAPAFWDKHTAAFRALMLVNLMGKLRRWDALPAALEADLEALLHTNTAFLAVPSNFESSFNHGYNQAVALICAAAKTPSPVLQYRRDGEVVWFATLLLAGAPGASGGTVDLELDGDLASVAVQAGNAAWSLTIDGLGDADESLLITPGAAPDWVD